jgi:hypothetical protein
MIIFVPLMNVILLMVNVSIPTKIVVMESVVPTIVASQSLVNVLIPQKTVMMMMNVLMVHVMKL